MTKTDLMLYVHIPFCARKCHYCDFLSGVYSKEIRTRYLSALQEEIRQRGLSLRERSISSVFFGGGTPSLLETEELAQIMRQIKCSTMLSEHAEITMECNPGTADFEKLKGYRELGINRLSIGVQSADNAELRLLGRIHTWEQFLEIYSLARKAGFDNVNVDLISALPGQSTENWERNLRSVLSLTPAPEHISAYSLILEEGTDFWEWKEQGKFQGSLVLPTEEQDREMYHLTREVLEEAGYQKYEISNYARPGYECRHNMGYWTRRDYLGVGLGAASLIGDHRYKNTEDLSAYLENPLADREEQKLSKSEEMEETMFLGLRRCKGVSKKEFQDRFSESINRIYADVIAKNVRDGLLLERDDLICLTDKGMDLSNYVSAQFLLT